MKLFCQIIKIIYEYCLLAWVRLDCLEENKDLWYFNNNELNHIILFQNQQTFILSFELIVMLILTH